MNRRKFVAIPGLALALPAGLSLLEQDTNAGEPVTEDRQDVLPDKILLKDFRPRSIFKIPKTEILKAKFPIFDAHHHAEAHTAKAVDAQLRLMDAVGVERTVVFSGIGQQFDDACKLYSGHPSRFDLWCGLDFRGATEPDFGSAAIKELRRCHEMGAVGLGEIIDKGRGLRASGAETAKDRSVQGPHADDPRMDSIFATCAALGMPVNIHVSDPIWGYEPQNRFNDGLMNGFSLATGQPAGHHGSQRSGSRAWTVRLNDTPRRSSSPPHFVNLNYDLTRLGQMLDRNPNLYADISARFSETAAIPRAMADFYTKYVHRLVYGTDMNYNQRAFSATFRILESLDEHFYEYTNYHWPQHGFGLSDDILVKTVPRDHGRRLQAG